MYQQGGISYTSNLAIRCLPRLEVIDGRPYYDGVEIPELGINANTGSSIRPNEYFVEQQARGSRDKRAHVNMAWGYGGKNFRNATEKKPYLGPKFWCPNMNQTSDYNNYPVFRYADALLMMAECCLAKEDKAGFETYMNMVRGRAGLPAYTVTKWPKAKEELIMERARELFGEFQRKFDLVRWGIWYERVQEYSDFDKLKQTMKPCHEFLPIPDKQVIYSGYALDNNAYKEYGL
jgi:hypothetical protein